MPPRAELRTVADRKRAEGAVGTVAQSGGREFFRQTDAIYGAPVSVHAPMWRKKADVPATELHRIVAELNVRVMHLRKLLEATDLEPVNRLPRFDATSMRMTLRRSPAWSAASGTCRTVRSTT
jgi:hypothetical protein